MRAVHVITLTTDFGTADWFVGTMKGVILNLNPRACLVDITHEIPDGDIRAGAFALAASYRFFPPHTLHVAVVDPGVGSGRAAIIAATAHYSFLGPDNGVLSLALDKEKVRAVYRLENEAHFLQPVSRTFHGRDVFAAVAGHWSAGVPINRFGPVQTGYQRLDWPEPEQTAERMVGQIVYIDRFGNGITNIPACLLATIRPQSVTIVVRRHRLPLAGFYQAVRPGLPLSLIGSSGYLELAVNGGSAAKRLGLHVGLSVSVKQKPIR